MAEWVWSMGSPAEELKRVESASRDMPPWFLLRRWSPSFHPRADNVPQLEAGGISQAAVMAFVITPSPCCPKPRGGAHIPCTFSGFPTFFPHLCKLSLCFPTCMCHLLPAGTIIIQSLIALILLFLPVWSVAHVLVFTSLNPDLFFCESWSRQKVLLMLKASVSWIWDERFCSAASPPACLGTFSSSHISGRACASRLGLMVSLWLPTWVESSDAIYVFFFFFEGCNILLPSVGPSLDAGPSSLDSHIFWGILFMSPFFLFSLPDSSLPSSTLHSSSLVHTDPYEPTNPRPLVLAGFGQNLYIYISGYKCISLPSEAPLSCCLLPQKVRALFQVVLCLQTLGTAFTSHPFWLGMVIA